MRLRNESPVPDPEAQQHFEHRAARKPHARPLPIEDSEALLGESIAHAIGADALALRCAARWCTRNLLVTTKISANLALVAWIIKPAVAHTLRQAARMATIAHCLALSRALAGGGATGSQLWQLARLPPASLP